jgi:hypothetical protein
LKETRPLWPPQRGVGLREPNLGKTNPRVTLYICLRFVLRPLSRTCFIITNANPACSCVYICKFQFRPIHPPLGDYHTSTLCILNSESSLVTLSSKHTHQDVGCYASLSGPNLQTLSTVPRASGMNHFAIVVDTVLLLKTP